MGKNKQDSYHGQGDPPNIAGSHGDPAMAGSRGDPPIIYGSRGDPAIMHGSISDPPIQLEARDDPSSAYSRGNDPPELCTNKEGSVKLVHPWLGERKLNISKISGQRRPNGRGMPGEKRRT